MKGDRNKRKTYGARMDEEQNDGRLGSQEFTKGARDEKFPIAKKKKNARD